MKYKEENKKFVEAWGREAQSRVAIEEMSELIKELCKLERYIGNNKEKEEETIEHIQEEIADVLNTVEQLQYIYGEEEVEKQRDYKTQRTISRLPKNMQ